MNTPVIDRSQLKSVVWELMKENKEFLKEIIAEMIQDKETHALPETRDEKVKALIMEDIVRYRKVWEALA